MSYEGGNVNAFIDNAVIPADDGGLYNDSQGNVGAGAAQGIHSQYLEACRMY